MGKQLPQFSRADNKARSVERYQASERPSTPAAERGEGAETTANGSKQRKSVATQEAVGFFFVVVTLDDSSLL